MKNKAVKGGRRMQQSRHMWQLCYTRRVRFTVDLLHRMLSAEMIYTNRELNEEYSKLDSGTLVVTTLYRHKVSTVMLPAHSVIFKGEHHGKATKEIRSFGIFGQRCCLSTGPGTVKEDDRSGVAASHRLFDRSGHAGACR